MLLEIQVHYAILPLLAAVAGGALVNWLGNRQVNFQNQVNATDQRKFDLQMWNLNNQYNSPVAQMGRLKEAGLNPNLIYGSGSASTGLSSSYPKAQIPTVVNTMSSASQAPMQALNSFYDLRLKEAQINAVNNNADLTLQKTTNEAFKKTLLQSQALKFDWDVQRGKSLLPYQQSMFEQNINKTRQSVNDLMFKNNIMNPLYAKGADLSNSLKKQQLDDLNPALLNLRMIQSSMQKLQYGFESKLMEHNATSKDSYLTRLFALGLDSIKNLDPFKVSPTDRFGKPWKPASSDEMRYGRYW